MQTAGTPTYLSQSPGHPTDSISLWSLDLLVVHPLRSTQCRSTKDEVPIPFAHLLGLPLEFGTHGSQPLHETETEAGNKKHRLPLSLVPGEREVGREGHLHTSAHIPFSSFPIGTASRGFPSSRYQFANPQPTDHSRELARSLFPNKESPWSEDER
jgi:hypothetical protein